MGSTYTPGLEGVNLDGKSELSGQSINMTTYQGVLYGANKLPNDVYLAAEGLIGFSENNTNRSIPIYGDTAKGSYHSWFTNIGAQLGKNIYALNQDLVLTPELDANYLFVHQGSYTESGSLMDLSVDSSNYASLVLGAYGRGAYHVATFSNHENLMVSAYAGLAHDVLDHRLQTTATFAAGGGGFTTAGPDLHGFFFRGGAGVTVANPTKPLKIALNYDFQAGNKTFSNVGALTLTYVF